MTMIETKLELSGSCHIELVEWPDEDGKIFDSSVDLTYTEHSPDPWYGNTDTYITINKEKAAEIIKLLNKAFDFGIEI